MASLTTYETGLNSDVDYHRDADGICSPLVPVRHRNDEYDVAHFELLLEMQERHFWYRGRHRFLLRAVGNCLKRRLPTVAQPSAVDLGGGCGGWIKYLAEHAPHMFADVALADSSRRALQLARPIVGDTVRRYHVDLNSLLWHDRWDAAFLLDVLEHIPGDAHVLHEICRALRPGGLLFVTTPALKCFWSYNDEMARHVRRYAKGDFRRLASECGMEFCYSRYFMTLLSPLVLLRRLKAPKLENMSDAEIVGHQRRTHRVPVCPLNSLLTAIFSLESPIGHWLPFPLGTSILAVLRKPR